MPLIVDKAMYSAIATHVVETNDDVAAREIVRDTAQGDPAQGDTDTCDADPRAGNESRGDECSFMSPDASDDDSVGFARLEADEERERKRRFSSLSDESDETESWSEVGKRRLGREIE